jgi:hypothetical protein
MSSPSGGGHWNLVVGWYPNTQQFLMHDPYGEADLVAGSFTRTAIGSGKSVRYSLKNWGARWQVDGPGTGWWIQINPKREVRLGGGRPLIRSKGIAGQVITHLLCEQ